MSFVSGRAAFNGTVLADRRARNHQGRSSSRAPRWPSELEDGDDDVANLEGRRPERDALNDARHQRAVRVAMPSDCSICRGTLDEDTPSSQRVSPSFLLSCGQELRSEVIGSAEPDDTDVPAVRMSIAELMRDEITAQVEQRPAELAPV